ncbi:outer membrane protein [Roseateles sp. YR242]|nr:outer membrane protein [Roseateles sp. YR242]
MRPRLQRTLAALMAAGSCSFLATAASAQSDALTPATQEAAEAGKREAPAKSGGSQWALGLGAGVSERAYAGADRKFTALPLLFYENDWLRFAGATAELKLLNHAFTPTQRLTGGLQVRYAPDGYKASDSSRLTGMAERKGGILGGFGLAWHNPMAQVRLDWSSDLSGHSKGQRLQLQADRRFQLGAASISPRLGAQWMDRKWVDYYYGVRAQEALADRPAYLGEAGVALEAGVRLDYAIQQRHVIFLDVGVTHLPKEVTNSPIVDRSNVPRAMVGYLYRF